MTPKVSERIAAEATELMQGSEIAALRFGGKWGEFMEGKAALLRALSAEVAAMEEQIEAFKKWNRRMWEQANPEAARNIEAARAMEGE